MPSNQQKGFLAEFISHHLTQGLWGTHGILDRSNLPVLASFIEFVLHQ